MYANSAAVSIPETKHHPGTAPDFQKIVVILVKPTSYDDNGFPQRYARGVLPSNSLAVVNTLTKQAFDAIVPNVPTEIHLLEDGIKRHADKLKELISRYPEKGTKLIVGFVAVQTAQFPRACDLIDRWQKVGATCVIGGFHVSGSIATLYDGVEDHARPGIPSPRIMPAEIQALMDRGVIVFHGEAENVWRTTLADILAGTPNTLYRGGIPDITHAPLPEFPASYFLKSFATPFGTVDTSRGCPFLCSFCTITNVQGRQMRYRDPEGILQMFRRQADRNGGRAYNFITDDNFGRNPRWKMILDGLATIRREGSSVSCMIEADLDCDRKYPDFIPKLAEAGCTQVFNGVESLNPANLEDANKWQNKIENFSNLFRKFHEHGIQVHAGYIIGFKHDTPESVARDIEKLFEIGVDQASFFIWTLLPGSEDHVRAVHAGVAIDRDFNQCDSFHPNTDHPTMSREEWTATYERSWRQFYRTENMVNAIKRCKTKAGRTNLLRNYVWYRWSFATERTHPMIAGFYRYRDYDDRRPGSPELSYGRYLVQEVFRNLRYLRRLGSEFFRFQQVMFELDLAPLIAEKRCELSGRVRGFGDWLRRTFGTAASREWLNAFWREYARKKWRLLSPHTYHWHLLTVPHSITEAVYAIRCAVRIPRLFKSTQH